MAKKQPLRTRTAHAEPDQKRPSLPDTCAVQGRHARKGRAGTAEREGQAQMPRDELSRAPAPCLRRLERFARGRREAIALHVVVGIANVDNGAHRLRHDKLVRFAHSALPRCRLVVGDFDKAEAVAAQVEMLPRVRPVGDREEAGHQPVDVVAAQVEALQVLELAELLTQLADEVVASQLEGDDDALCIPCGCVRAATFPTGFEPLVGPGIKLVKTNATGTGAPIGALELATDICLEPGEVHGAAADTIPLVRARVALEPTARPVPRPVDDDASDLARGLQSADSPVVRRACDRVVGCKAAEAAFRGDATRVAAEAAMRIHARVRTVGVVEARLAGAGAA